MYRELATKFDVEYIARGLRKVVCSASMFFLKYVSLVFWFQYCCFTNQKTKQNVMFQHCFLRGELTIRCALVLLKQLQYVSNWVLFYFLITKSCYNTQVETT
jgi:hypothetical protein